MPRKKKKKTEQFYFRTSLRMNGVEVMVEASSYEEALEKANAGEWDDCDFNTGEFVDWKIKEKRM